ncbi:hypothetical protein D9758_007198 [Tetrapyrgos nigripes]|uniref:Copper-fist domain-containing protein n=1 Tax=Tetrapyrgos nigripes TaxID=182062 RepID=A0A8H5FVR4_9AGAR|nr:hypothetical protein D9758_007198 [Tetrapyrgos nigripes]
MVLISSKKYACETCIKGHRSSSCQHTDRPLYEIKKKGRPVTQCEHCRELRKTKQVHVKCICQKADGAGNTASTSGKQGVSKMLESAAFPNGLPEALEASVALQLLSEGTSSDSDHVGCTCKTNGECHCCTPRKSAPKSRKKSPPKPSTSDASPLPGPEFQATESSSHVLNRIAELRPVLPKPAISFPDGPLHDPSSSGQVSSRHHPLEYYSPYGRAYDNIHPHGHSHAYQQSHPQLPLDLPNYPSADSIPHDSRDPEYLPTQTNLSFVSPIEPSQPSDQGSNTAENDVWNVFQQYGVLCGCGDACACPNCLTHRGANVPVSTPNNTPTNSPSHGYRSPCVNPDSCGACLECLMFSSFPGLAPPNASDVGNDSSTTSDIDQWLASLPQSALDSITSGPITPFQLLPPLDERMQSQRDVRDCRCPPGLCQCSDCGSDCQSSVLSAQGSSERQVSPPYSATSYQYPMNDSLYNAYNPSIPQLRMDFSQAQASWEAVDTTNDFDFFNTPSSQSLDPMMAMKRTRSASSSSSEASDHSHFSGPKSASPAFSDGPVSGHSSQESLHAQSMGYNQGMGIADFY